jgi:hypothetical protein
MAPPDDIVLATLLAVNYCIPMTDGVDRGSMLGMALPGRIMITY